MRTLIALLVSFTALVLAADDFPPPLERFLFPVVVSKVPGAMGSSWSSYAKLYDPSERNTVVLPDTFCDEPDRGDELPRCDSPIGPTKPPRVFPLGVFPTRPGDTGGAFVYVERAFADRLSLSLYLRHSDEVPQQIPVVREREFRREVQLIDVPDRDGYRLMLRVYGSDPEVSGSVRVRIFTANFPDDEQLLSDEVLDLHLVQRYYAHYGSAPFRLPTRPWYAERYFGLPLTVDDDTLRFEISPVTEGIRLWAMISVTNNTTQQVTLRVP